MPAKMNLMGRRFGRLTVVAEAPRNSSGKVRWTCRCDCGKERIAIGTLLASGKVTSCGCKKNARQRLFQIWADMLARCNNPNIACWKHYGGRGIEVCAEWMKFASFKAWAETTGYSNDLTIDRIDSDGNYEPDNCRWITLYENQMRGFEKAHNVSRRTGRWLSNEQILYILQHRDVSAKELAKRFNKCEQTIRNVWNGLTKVH